MNKTVISIEHLSKSYRLGQIGTGTFAHDLNVWWARVRGRPNPLAKIGAAPSPPSPLLLGEGRRGEGEIIWALRDVTFKVEQGEVLGIIGRNGAGKSTLLKILSRVTAPTSGRVRVRGRVASLLEVGTGFHPELTGRENVYLNGAILGMDRREIARKFDEIVDFAGVEKFIDTPVKRYSSGMYVRLAFAVAAHLDPEILVVDEVLAVGDAEFQKKCLGKMGEAAQGGRTVLFVSHNLPMIRQLCQQAILLDKGWLVEQGASDEVVSTYLKTNVAVLEDASAISALISRLPPDPAFRLVDVRIQQEGQSTVIVGNGKPVEITLEYVVLERTFGLRVFFDLLDDNDVILFRSFHDGDAETAKDFMPGHYISTAAIPANWLAPTTYHIEVHAGIHNVRMVTPGGIRIPLTVENTGIVNRAYVDDPIRGRLSPRIEWNTETVRQQSS